MGRAAVCECLLNHGSSDDDLIVIEARRLDVLFDVLDHYLLEHQVTVTGTGPRVGTQHLLRLPEWSEPTLGHHLTASLSPGTEHAVYHPRRNTELLPFQRLGFGNALHKVVENPFLS